MHIYFGAFFALSSLIAAGVVASTVARDDPQREQRSKAAIGIAWLAILLTTLLSPTPFTVTYQGAIGFCILTTGLSLVFYRLTPGPRAVGIALQMLNLGVLWIAFATLTTFRLPTIWTLIAPLLGVLAYWRLVPAPRVELRPDIIALIALWAAVTWQAIELWHQIGQTWTLFAVLGMLLLWIPAWLHKGTLEIDNARPESADTFSAYAVTVWLLGYLALALSVWML